MNCRNTGHARTRVRSAGRNKLAAGLLLLLRFLLVMTAAFASEKPADRPEVENLLREVSDYLTGLESFTVDIVMSTAAQADECKTDATDRFTVALKKPNLLAVLPEERGRSVWETIVSDGSTLYALHPLRNRYSAVSAPENLGARFVSVLIRGCLGGIANISSKLLEREFESPLSDELCAKCMGLEQEGGAEYHVVRFHGKGVMWDLWVEAGATPLPHKIIASLSEDLERQFTLHIELRFENWLLDAEIPQETFSFVPPRDVVLEDRSADEKAASAMLKVIYTFERMFARDARVDQDRDGRGEYGFFAELSGVVNLRGQPHSVEPYLALADKLTGGVLEEAGYYFKIYLPGNLGSVLAEEQGEPLPIASGGGVNLQERHFILYAWPKVLGRTATRTYAVSEKGQIYATEMQKTKYEGLGAVPLASAVYEAAAFTSRFGSGSDGNTWVAIKGF